MDQKKIGAFIAQCRKEKSLTQIQLAELLDITNQAVSKWENGVSRSEVSRSTSCAVRADILERLSRIRPITV